MVATELIVARAMIFLGSRGVSDSGCWCERLHDALAHQRIILPSSCLEQGSSVLAKGLTLGLKHGRVNLSVLGDNVMVEPAALAKLMICWVPMCHPTPS